MMIAGCLILICLMRAGKALKVNRSLKSPVVHLQEAAPVAVPINTVRELKEGRRHCAQAPSNEDVSVSGGISAFTRLTPASARTPPSPSWGSVNSSGRRFHARYDSDSSGRNLSDRDSSSGERTIRIASLATSSDMREPISLSQDAERDTQAEGGSQ